MHEHPMFKPVALTIAGFDPCGGAGLQADLKTFQAHGVYGLSVATAITVQNTQGVTAVHPLPADYLREQLYNLLDDFQIRAVKIGMLGSAENAQVVERFLADAKIKHVVLDTIVKSQSGYSLNNEACVKFLKEKLIPRSFLITPNVEEVAILCGFQIMDQESMSQAANYLHKLGADYVLIKGGIFEENTICDLLYDGRNCSFRIWSKIAGPSPHGTGCVLASAITSNLAQDKEMTQALSNAQDYLYNLRQHLLKLGSGYPLLF